MKRLPEWKAETGGLEAREAYSKRLKRHLKQRFTCRSFSRSFVFFFSAEDRVLTGGPVLPGRKLFLRILCGMWNFSMNDFVSLSEGVHFNVELLACISTKLMCFDTV